MLKTYRIIPLVFILFLFGFTLFTVAPVFAHGKGDYRTTEQLIKRIQKLEAAVSRLGGQTEAPAQSNFPGGQTEAPPVAPLPPGWVSHPYPHQQCHQTLQTIKPSPSFPNGKYIKIAGEIHDGGCKKCVRLVLERVRRSQGAMVVERKTGNRVPCDTCRRFKDDKLAGVMCNVNGASPPELHSTTYWEKGMGMRHPNRPCMDRTKVPGGCGPDPRRIEMQRLDIHWTLHPESRAARGE